MSTPTAWYSVVIYGTDILPRQGHEAQDPRMGEKGKIFMALTIKEAKERFHEDTPAILNKMLSRSKDGKGWICPFCGHGKGGDGLKDNPKSQGAGLKCFGCDWSGDVIALYQDMNNVSFLEAMQALAELTGNDIETTKGSYNTQEVAKENEVDYATYYFQCMERLADQEQGKPGRDYLTQRGISMETAKLYGLGYDPEADPANAPGGNAEKRHPEPRIIIPFSLQAYMGRAIRPEIDKRWKKLNSKNSTPQPFNVDALYSTGQRAVFITEGAFDALSIIEATGAPALAINGTGNVQAILDRLDEKRPEAKLIFCMDKDPAGMRATEALITGARERKIPLYRADLNGEYGDINERLQEDRAGLKTDINRAMLLAERPYSTALYITRGAMAKDIKAFQLVASTGFKSLDQALGGGLYPGLITLAAATSSGKTTFSLQAADQAAKAGADVLYFSLEQSRLEMTTKSLARTIYEMNEAGPTSLDIRKRKVDRDQLDAATERYLEETGGRVSILEGNFGVNVKAITEAIDRHIDLTGRRPLVILDYLQIIQPEVDSRGRAASTKETVDEVMTQLKRMSRARGIAVIAISSINRGSYLQPISLESLKETGSIEFTSDVVLGLQFHDVYSDPETYTGESRGGSTKTKQRENIQKLKGGSPRTMCVDILKNRFGALPKPGTAPTFLYYPEHDYFKEGEEKPEQTKRREIRL